MAVFICVLILDVSLPSLGKPHISGIKVMLGRDEQESKIIISLHFTTNKLLLGELLASICDPVITQVVLRCRGP